jgi:hypothetical protein
LKYRPSASSSDSSHGHSTESDPKVTVTAPGSNVATPLRHQEASNLVFTRLQEALSDAKVRGAQQLKLDRAFVEAIVQSVESNIQELSSLRGKFDGVKVSKLI